jgi:Fur family ferric uptake transcriptional regulator
MKKHSHSVRPQLPELTDCLRRKSRRITGQRQAILHALRSHPHPMSSKEVQSRLGCGDCDLATIYRSLHLLESIGMVKRFDLGDGVARYELVGTDDDGHHHHLICLRCSEVVEIDHCFPRALEEQIARHNGYTGVTHRLEFFGVCPRCRWNRIT